VTGSLRTLRPTSKPKQQFGVTLGRNGIFIGTPRLLDITWGKRVRWTIRTYNHVLILSLRHLPRIEWSRW
jgi:hypothetical protein